MTLIWVKFVKEGIHCYPNAPDAVAYLRNPHHHEFHFKVWIEVHHDDRDIEFHMFRNWLNNLYDDKTLQLDHKSCEMMIEDLYQQIVAKYPRRHIQIEVSEDNSCGAIKSFEVVSK